MLAFNQAHLAGGFRSQEDVIMADLRASLAKVEQLIERVSPQMAARPDAIRVLGAPASSTAESAEALQKLQAAARMLRDGIAALSRPGHA
jgi:hypothetical protein